MPCSPPVGSNSLPYLGVSCRVDRECLELNARVSKCTSGCPTVNCTTSNLREGRTILPCACTILAAHRLVVLAGKSGWGLTAMTTTGLCS
jgi:hypothetical protein